MRSRSEGLIRCRLAQAYFVPQGQNCSFEKSLGTTDAFKQFTVIVTSPGIYSFSQTKDQAGHQAARARTCALAARFRRRRAAAAPTASTFAASSPASASLRRPASSSSAAALATPSPPPTPPPPSPPHLQLLILHRPLSTSAQHTASVATTITARRPLRRQRRRRPRHHRLRRLLRRLHHPHHRPCFHPRHRHARACRTMLIVTGPTPETDEDHEVSSSPAQITPTGWRWASAAGWHAASFCA